MFKGPCHADWRQQVDPDDTEAVHRVSYKYIFTCAVQCFVWFACKYRLAPSESKCTAFSLELNEEAVITPATPVKYDSR